MRRATETEAALTMHWWMTLWRSSLVLDARAAGQAHCPNYTGVNQAWQLRCWSCNQSTIHLEAVAVTGDETGLCSPIARPALCRSQSGLKKYQAKSDGIQTLLTHVLKRWLNIDCIDYRWLKTILMRDKPSFKAFFMLFFSSNRSFYIYTKTDCFSWSLWK